MRLPDVGQQMRSLWVHKASPRPGEGQTAGRGLHCADRRGHVGHGDRGGKPRLAWLLAKPVKTARIKTRAFL